MKDYIKIETSSNYLDSDGSRRDPWIIFKYDSSNDRWATQGEEKVHWIQIKLLIYKFRITSYTIRSVEEKLSLRGWKLEASSNYGATNKTIDSVASTTELYNFRILERPVNDTSSLFNTFKFTMIGKPIDDSIMRISSLEFFGSINFVTSCTKYRSKSLISLSLVIYLLTISYNA